MERCNQETGGSIWNFLFLYTYGETKKYIRQGTLVGGGITGRNKNTGRSCHLLLRGIFPTQGSNPGLLHWQMSSLPLSQ